MSAETELSPRRWLSLVLVVFVAATALRNLFGDDLTGKALQGVGYLSVLYVALDRLVVRIPLKLYLPVAGIALGLSLYQFRLASTGRLPSTVNTAMLLLMGAFAVASLAYMLWQWVGHRKRP